MPLTLKNQPTYYEISSIIPGGTAAGAFMQNLGGIIKIEPLGKTLMDIVRSQGMTDGTLYIIGTFINATTRLTGMLAFQTVAGNYTADNYNGMALYKWNGTNIVLVAQTANDAAIWTTTSNTWRQKAFTTPYNAQAGVYYMAALYNSSAQVTAPSLGGMALMQNAGTFDTVIPANTAPYMTRTSVTSLPNPIVTPGAINNGIYLALY